MNINTKLKHTAISLVIALILAVSAAPVLPAYAAVGTSVNEEVVNQARSVASIIQTRIQLYWSDWVDKQIPYTQDPLTNPAPTWATDAEIAGLVGGATPDGMTFTVEGMPVARDGSFYLVATVDSSMGGAAAASYVRNFLPMAIAASNSNVVKIPVLRPSFALGLSDIANNPNKVNRDGTTDDGEPTFTDGANITFGDNGSITFDPVTGGNINNVNNLDARNITVSDTLTTNTANITGNAAIDGDLTVGGNITGDLTGNTTGTHTGAVIGNVAGNVTGNLTGNVTGNSSTATRLATARTIALNTGATGTATAFSGAANISIPVTALNAGYLNAGTVPVGRLTGNYGINITGKATTAGLADTAKYANGAGLLKDTDGEAAGAFTIRPLSGGYIEFGGASAPAVVKFGATGTVQPTEYWFGALGDAKLKGIAESAVLAASATKLAEAKSIALGTAATGTATAFDGTGSITIPVTALNAGYLSAGTIPTARLSGTYAIGISGKAATAGAADTAASAATATSAASAGKLVPTYAAQSSYKDPAVNVNIVGTPNDRDTWIYRDPAGGSSNWGIYHRNIDSEVAGLPDNSIGFIGNSILRAYINLGNGNARFGSINTSGIHMDAGQIHAANANGDRTFGGAIHVRETGYVGAGTDNWETAPKITFHWGGRAAASLALASNQQLYKINNGGGSQELMITSANIGSHSAGNATTATQLAVARTIALGTGVTGTATAFNGTANITIPVTALNAGYLSAGTIPTARLSGSYNITARYAQELSTPISSVAYAENAGSATTLKYWNIDSKYNLSAMPWGRVSNYYSTTLWENGPSGMSYGTVYNLGGSGSYNNNSLSLQLAADVNHDSASSTRKLWFRTGNNLGFQNDWKEILHEGNIGSYAAGNVTTPSGTYKHLGAWGVGRTAAGAILVNTAYTADRASYADSAGSAPGGIKSIGRWHQSSLPASLPGTSSNIYSWWGMEIGRDRDVLTTASGTHVGGTVVKSSFQSSGHQWVGWYIQTQ